MAIQSFSDKVTAEFFIHGMTPRRVGWRQLARIAKRKLDMLHYAHHLNDLKSPPGNKLEALGKDLKGYHSIRINDQWRIVFKWTASGPTEVYITDYH
jgi:proteic killer suppression protein